MNGVTSSVGVDNLPPVIRSVALPDAHYADLTTITVPDARSSSPEQWLRAVLEESGIGRYAAPRLWRALGLRLGPRDAEHVQGWRIVDAGQDWIRVRTASWYMAAEAMLVVGDADVSLALLLRFDHSFGRGLWAGVGPGHRRGVPRMLADAVAIRRAGR